MRSTIFASVAVLFTVAISAHASTQQPPPPSSGEAVISAYRLYKDVSNLQILVPTVVEVPFSEPFFERNEVAIVNVATGAFEPAYVKVTANNVTQVSAKTIPSTDSATKMLDGDTRTYTDFPLPNTEQGSVQILLTSTKPITSTSLMTLLDANVSLPTSIEIRAVVSGKDTIVVAKKVMSAYTTRFPKTTSHTWTVTYTYAQPLRISELKLIEDDTSVSTTHAVRFLAQPKQSYRIYFNPDRLAYPDVGESANLASAKDILMLPAGVTQTNTAYLMSDVDDDGVPDVYDNCVSLANTDQADVNNNLRGDVCDDFDQDGVINVKDNCPDQPNVNQADKDSDGVGDVCDKEESRITERYAWLPWAGLGLAVFILVALFAITMRKTVKDAGKPDVGTPTS